MYEVREGGFSKFYMIPALTFITAASKADVTILFLTSITSISFSGSCYFGSVAELGDSVKLPCFSTLIAAIGLGDMKPSSDVWLDKQLLVLKLKPFAL